MLDYKEIYLKMFRASEQALNILISAQQECEERHISMSEAEGTVVPLPMKLENNMECDE